MKQFTLADRALINLTALEKIRKCIQDKGLEVKSVYFSGGSVWRPPVMNMYTAGMPDELVEEEDAKENMRGTLSNRLVQMWEKVS